MHKDFFDFKLSHPISGNITDLILYAPRNIHRPITAKLHSMLNNAFMEAAKMSKDLPTDSNRANDESNEDADSKVNTEQILMALRMNPLLDYNFYASFCDEFRALMCSDNICKVKTNDQKLQPAYYDQMTSADGDRLMGEYLENFFPISGSS